MPTPDATQESTGSAADSPAIGGPAPRDAHARRQGVLEEEARRHARASRAISGLRLITFVGAAGLAAARGFGYLPFWCWWVAAGLAGMFVALVVAHARVDRIERRVAAAIAFHRWAIVRIDGKYAEYPSRGERFRSDEHPYAADLDLFGESSLFQLLDSTHTRRGEDMLARWLTEPSERDEIMGRQAAVRELQPHESVREELAVLGTLIRADKPDPGPLVAWAESPLVVTKLPFARLAALALPAVLGAVFVLVQLEVVPGRILLLAALGQWLYALALLPKVEPIASAVSAREGALARYRSMLELMARERFETPHLRRLQEKLERPKNRGGARPRK